MQKRILIIDDDRFNREVLLELLGDVYEVDAAEDGEKGLDKMKEFGPDLVLLDIMMPGIDGYEVCRRIKNAPDGELTLVVLVSGRASAEERLKGYEAGADDYVVKPFNHDELVAKTKVLLRLRGALIDLARAKSEIEINNQDLELLVQRRTTEVTETRNVTVFALAKLAESRDPETGEHLERMRHYAQLLAEELARTGPYTESIDEKFLRDLYLSSPLHDIGKVGIPDAILLKPGQLSTGEFRIMQRHTLIGAESLKEAAGHTKSGGFLDMAVEIARSHHERFNGSGYPDGLQGVDIPLAARIVALADVYDALTSVRVYKSAFDSEVATSMIENESGQHFDAVVVGAFRRRHDDFLQVPGQCKAAEKDLVTA